MNQPIGLKPQEFPGQQYIIKLMQNWEKKSEEERRLILDEMRLFDRDKVIEVLNILLHNSDSHLQSYAIDILMSIDKQRGIDLLLPLLNAREAGLRWFICDLLVDDGDERAVEPLIKVLLEDPDSSVRLQAIVALNCIGDRRAIPSLEYAMEHDNGQDEEGRQINEFAKDAIESILRRSK